MITKLLTVWLSLMTVGARFAAAQDSTSFENGWDGWKSAGSASLIHRQAFHGKSCVEIKGTGRLYRRFEVNPLSIVLFKVFIKSGDPRAKGYTCLSFYTDSGRLILQYQGKAVSDTAYGQSGYYTEAPPDAKYFTVEIRKDSSGKGALYADDADVKADVEGKPAPPPTCDLDQYMRPFWTGDTIYNEPVLLMSRHGAAASGRLLYRPRHVLSVTSYDLKTTYRPGRDYQWKGDTIMRMPGSAMPFKTPAFFPGDDLAWYHIESQWISVTYTHADRWDGPIPSYKGDELPLTTARLSAKKPLTIVAYGMSITRGMDVSGYDKVPPYMPPYVTLFARQLGKLYDDPAIRLYNAGLPGATAEWGAEYADTYVNPLRPDLVIVDFGMNDFWNDTPAQFKRYIETIMRKIRSKRPHVEFLLLSNMQFDPAYVGLAQ